MSLYVAYGSNLNMKQMSIRCPTAAVVGSGTLKGYRLAFCGVATVFPCEGNEVPVAVWEIDEDCERALDRYEGYPRLYRKETVEVEVDGVTLDAMIYIMNRSRLYPPASGYYRTIEQGYEDFGLDVACLERARAEAD